MKKIFILAIVSVMLNPLYGQTDTMKVVSDESEQLITARLDSLAADLLRQHRMLITPVDQTNDRWGVPGIIHIQPPEPRVRSGRNPQFLP